MYRTLYIIMYKGLYIIMYKGLYIIMYKALPGRGFQVLAHAKKVPAANPAGTFESSALF